MRRILRSLIVQLLTSLASGIVRRHQPMIIGITGSVGKTLTKDAVFAALHGSFSIWKSPKNLNTEIGVPLSIMRVSDAPGTLWGWMRAIRQGMKLRYGRATYPEVLVLEMAADKPGDIAHLVKLAPPQIGIVTAVGMTHLKQFGTVEAVAREKAELIRALPKDGFALLSGDDALTRKMAAETDATVATFGLSAQAEIHAAKTVVALKAIGLDGLRPEYPVTLTATVQLEDAAYSLELPGFVAEYQLGAFLAAIGVARSLDIDPRTAIKRLHALAPAKGRMRVLYGLNHSLIIDDSYNASPLAMQAALQVLKKFPKARRRIAALGEMAELGDSAEDAHRSVGVQAAQFADQLLLTGAQVEAYRTGAVETGPKVSAARTFPGAREIGAWLKEHLEPGDVVLIKGSQVSRMERAVAQILVEADQAPEVLVRQDAAWKKRP